jgi:probable F420-dependent oxidoreductase
LRFRIALPGTNHLPPANDHVPEAAQWATRLGAEDFQCIARAVDELGYDAISTSEHYGMPYFEVPRLGPFWMDALSVMAFVVGATKRVRVDTSVLVAPYHHPLALAKALATIDVLSGGRVDVSLGVGHAVREFEVLGVPFEERGAITDETIEAMLELWSSDEPEFAGRYFKIDGLAFEPKPVQKPRPPIYIGGNSKVALRRAARFEGWQPNPTEFDAESIPGLLEYVHAQPEFAGKEKSFQVCWVGTVPGLERPMFPELSGGDRSKYRDQILERVEHLSSLGVTMVLAPQPYTRSLDDFLEYIAWFDEEVVDVLR